MNVRELNREQIIELKQGFLFSLPEWPSWRGLADADELVDDETIFDLYEGTDFVPEDFNCSPSKFRC